jgi:phosphate/sulfate permease
MTLILIVILVALVFEYINGFHDTANSIATVVATKVLTPRQAVVLAAITNLLGALWGTAVAKTIASGLVETSIVTSEILVCALVGAIIWNLITWWFGLPSSSSHALVGGLCGAAVAAAHGKWGVIIWSIPGKDHWWEGKGVLWKVVVPMVTSPVCGLVIGFLVMGLLYFLLRNWKPMRVNKVFGKAQLFSAAYMGFSHGTNDAQKTMGIIALALVAATSAGTFNEIPSWLRFLDSPPGKQAISSAMNQLGEMHRDGIGIKQDLAEAGRWFHKASDKENPDAMENWAAMISAGQVKDTPPSQATTLLEKAAKLRGTTPARAQAFLTPTIKGTPTNTTEALAWLQQLATKGNASAAAYLGVILIEGKGTAPDEQKGLERLRHAAKHGSPEAQFNLGLLYRTGRIVERSEKRAHEYFLQAAHHEGIKTWIKVICALTMAAGTAAGGWRIIKTLGHKMVRLHPVHGFAAETTSATVLAAAAHLGMPVSTTHAITTSIMGVGCAKGFNHLKLSVVERILWAWVLTIPASGITAYLCVKSARALGWIPA